MTSTTWNPVPAALESWSVAELVAFFMCASEPSSWLSDDESEVEC